MTPFREGGPTPEQMGIRPAAEMGKRYHDHAVVNGIEIEVRWDDTNGDYLIYFPQVNSSDETREEATERGIYNQVIRISESPEIARATFRQAERVAQRTTDVLNVVKYMQDYVNSFESR